MSPMWKWPRRRRSTTEASETAKPSFTNTSSDKLHFTLSGSNGNRTLVVMCPDGKAFTFPNEHPNYATAVDLALEKGEKDSEAYRKLFDVEENVRNLFGVITDRVRVAEGIVYFDEQPVHNIVTDTILRFMEEGREDFAPLAKFMEQLEANPNKTAKDTLFSWLEKQDLAIDADGWVIGFKGVHQDYTPSYTGPGIVDGVEVEPGKKIVYKPGSLVSIPRNLVNEDPRQHCGVGLHVGTRSFAKSFVSGGRVLEVRFSPADVVSVDNSNRAKIRVCRLRVVGEAPPADNYNKALRLN